MRPVDKLVRDAVAANPNMTRDQLEELADILLSDTLKARSRTKAQREEYPILSDRQLQRRGNKEIPFSALPKSVKITFGLQVTEREDG